MSKIGLPSHFSYIASSYMAVRNKANLFLFLWQAANRILRLVGLLLVLLSSAKTLLSWHGRPSSVRPSTKKNLGNHQADLETKFCGYVTIYRISRPCFWFENLKYFLSRSALCYCTAELRCQRWQASRLTTIGVCYRSFVIRPSSWLHSFSQKAPGE